MIFYEIGAIRQGEMWRWRIQLRWQTQQMRRLTCGRQTQHFRRWLAIGLFCASRSEFYEADFRTVRNIVCPYNEHKSGAAYEPHPHYYLSLLFLSWFISTLQFINWKISLKNPRLGFDLNDISWVQSTDCRRRENELIFVQNCFQNCLNFVLISKIISRFLFIYSARFSGKSSINQSR